MLVNARPVDVASGFEGIASGAGEARSLSEAPGPVSSASVTEAVKEDIVKELIKEWHEFRVGLLHEVKQLVLEMKAPQAVPLEQVKVHQMDADEDPAPPTEIIEPEPDECLTPLDSECGLRKLSQAQVQTASQMFLEEMESDVCDTSILSEYGADWNMVGTGSAPRTEQPYDLLTLLPPLLQLPMLEMLQVSDILQLRVASCAAVDGQALAHHLAQGAELSRPSSLIAVWPTIRKAQEYLRPTPAVFQHRASRAHWRDEIHFTLQSNPLLQKRYWCFQWCSAQTRASRCPWSEAAREHALLAVNDLYGICCESTGQANYCALDLMGLLALNSCEEVQHTVIPIVPSLLQSIWSTGIDDVVASKAREMVAASHRVMESSERERCVGLATNLLLYAVSQRREGMVDLAVHMLELLCGDLTPAQARASFQSDISKVDRLVETMFLSDTEEVPGQVLRSVLRFLHFYT
ncbi:unnamed protein product [Symbiodinium sp. CCMP2456]|nr:unnamed protein product [Symbiodinium sp. CCMP2456]